MDERCEEDRQSSTFDIVQAPKWMRREDLPPEIVLDVPFEVKGCRFVLAKAQSQDLSTCSLDSSSGLTTAPNPSGNYYVIRRIG